MFGVRYPEDLQEQLRSHGLIYGGWVPNHRVADCFGRARVTLHVPRRPYVEALPGIPTIRVFEALACGIPLISAPWEDVEGLFPAGCYLKARNADDIAAALRSILQDRDRARDIFRKRPAGDFGAPHVSSPRARARRDNRKHSPTASALDGVRFAYEMVVP